MVLSGKSDKNWVKHSQLEKIDILEILWIKTSTRTTKKNGASALKKWVNRHFTWV